MPFLILVLLLIPNIFFAQAISVFNANSVADIIEKYTAKISSFKGTFVYKQGRLTQTGIITYVSPDKLLMQFGTEDDPINKKIVSDGDFIWVQDGDIIARQKMNDTQSPINGWNIRKLRRQYIPTAPATGLEVRYGNVNAYRIILQPKVNTSSFRSIEIISDRDGLIYRITGESRVGTTTELSLIYKEFNKEYDNRTFIVNTTEDSQIYDNIFE